MLIPYRVKNPIQRFPIATAGIIGLNVLIYIFTTNYLVVIRESVVKSYGYGLGISPFWAFITAAFLHAEPFHLFGNMLFLWVFGPPVEDRLGIPRFLLLYFAAGLCGDVLQGGIDVAVLGKVQMGIGASGCIMGVLGAYWYLFSWSPVCVFYWVGWYWHGLADVAAFWIIGLFILWDLVDGFFFGLSGMSGVANFAHIGGAFAGALLCLAMKMKRDTEALSEAKAVKAEVKDLSLMPLHALQTMVEEDPCNPELIRAMIKPALGLNQRDALDEAFTRAGPALAEKDPGLVAYYLLALQGNHAIYGPAHLMRAAGSRERAGDPAQALELYIKLVQSYPPSPDVETAMYRMAQCYWNNYRDAENTRNCLQDMLSRYPTGAMAPYGQAMLRQIGQGS